MPRPDPGEDPEVTLYFRRKIAGLIIKGRYGRVQREMQRFNQGRQTKMKLLPTQEEQLAWAHAVLERGFNG